MPCPLGSNQRNAHVAEVATREMGCVMSNNSSIYGADRKTHLKIVLVSLVSGVVVVAVGLAAVPKLPDMSTQLEARAPVLKADKRVIWTSSERITVR